MFNIHKLYLNELKNKKQFVTKQIVKSYVYKLPTKILVEKIVELNYF